MLLVLLFILVIAAIALNLFALPIYIWLLKRWSPIIGVIFLGGMILGNAVAAIAVASTMGGGFGLGTWVLLASGCSAPLGSFVLGIFLFSRRNNFSLAVGDNQLKRRLYWAGGILLVVIPFTPAVGSMFVGSYCDGIIERAADPIIQATNNYRQAQGQYPETVAALVPAYLNRVPTAPSCMGKSNDSVEYRLEECSTSITLLTARYSFTGSGVLRYDFRRGNWSSISFLDGACSFLR